MCENCYVYFCDGCIEGPFHEGEGCWRCPDHGIGCTDNIICDVCKEQKCSASHKFYFCEYCHTEICRDCLKDLNIRIAECSDPACREERSVYIHCFPLCAGGSHGLNAGVANPCTGVADPPGPFENLNAGDIHALMEVGMALEVFGAVLILPGGDIITALGNEGHVENFLHDLQTILESRERRSRYLSSVPDSSEIHLTSATVSSVISRLLYRNNRSSSS
ncbi:hypothetical protein TrRE_jg7024, partial [Triparma retinervis]